MLKFSNWLITTLCLGLAFLHGLFLYSGFTGTDDVYMTYWSAKALSDGGQIINYNGDAIEPSSSLLHVIILATLYKLSGIPLAILGIVFSVLMGGMTLLVAWYLAHSLNIKYPWFVIFFYALFPYLVYWSFAGLETTLVALLVTLLVYTTIKIFTQKITNSLFLAIILLIFAYILARPEAIFIISLFFLEMAAYMLIYNRFNQKREVTYTTIHYVKLTQLLGISLIIFILLSLWRYQTFGQIFPQPVYAKVAVLSLSNLLDGIEYLFQHYWMPSLAILTGLVVFGTVQILRHRFQDIREHAVVIILWFFLAQMAFVVTKGNDWIEGGRFLVPVLPLLMVAGLYAIQQLPVRIVPIILVWLSLTALIDNAKFNKYHSRGTYWPLAKTVSEPVINDFESIPNRFHWPEQVRREHLAYIPPIIMLDKIITRLLEIKSSLTIISGDMGIIPFYIANQHFGKVEFIDMYGLTTPHLTHCNLEDYLQRQSDSHLFRGRFGIQINFEFLFDHFNEIKNRCPIRYPDIVCGMGHGQWVNNLEESKQKYQRIYHQFGRITIGDCWSRRKENANYFIAVHQDLLAKTNELQLDSYKWPQVKCEMKRSW
jgi:hypothetical protein